MEGDLLILPVLRQDNNRSFNYFTYFGVLMLRDLSKVGFASIVEVIVTSVIFILATAGILTTISMLQPHAVDSSRKVEAAYVAKGVMDQLRHEVDATSFDVGDLAVGTHPMGMFGDFNVTYAITEPDPGVRFMNMTVSWPDL